MDKKPETTISLPEGVTISTISATCNLNTLMNLINISKFLELSNNDIISIKHDKSIRSLEPIKTKRKKATKKTKNFYNQITMVIKVDEEKNINVKLFTNGSVQMTGCKSIDNCNVVLQKLMNRLKDRYYIIEDNEIIEKQMVESLDKLEIKNFKIDMINSNFKINYKINREILHNIMKSMSIDSGYKPNIHACVNIKYQMENKISIFVFESGNIIITGAKCTEHIINAYNFITKILNDNINNIKKRDIINIIQSKLARQLE